MHGIDSVLIEQQIMNNYLGRILVGPIVDMKHKVP